jgi:TonB-linked SusC/RagA family outer membrane protein
MKYFIFILFVLGTCSYGWAQKTSPPDTAKRKQLVLDSVIVFNNGYQSIPKERATGSFTQVDNAVINQQVGTNILGRLEAVASGVSFSKKTNGSMPPVTVRGLSTINGPTAPLIVLDNFPYEGDINAINPALIESVTILKDATAASIWGTRAGNGVIVINTKKGKYNQPLRVECSSSVQLMPKPGLSQLHTIAPSDFIDVEQMLFSKGYYSSQLSSTSHPVISPVVELLDRQSRGLISAAELNTKLAALRNTDIKEMLDRDYYNSSVNRQYALSFSGGTSRSAWLAAGGYDDNLSGLAEKYERRSLRIENSFTPVKNLKLVAAIYLTGTNTKTGKDDYASQDYLYPYSGLYDSSGKPVAFGRSYRLSYTDTLGGGKLADWGYYPADEYLHRYTTLGSTNLVTSFGAQYSIGKGFSADLKYQSETQHSQRRALSDEQSYTSRYYVNLYAQINPANGVVTYMVPQGGILDITNSDIRVSNYRAQLNYNRGWAKHRLSAIAGSETREIHTTEESYRTYGYSDELAIGSLADLKNRYPVITTGQLTTIPSGENAFTDQLKRYVSFFGNAAYSYDNKYSFTLSARRDASNLFGVVTNQKWTPLWSAGAGWEISKAGFYRSALLPYLKLRATYGYTGNADPSRSGVVTVFVFNNSAQTGFANYRIRQFPNPDLRWEQVAITNLGIDFGLKNSRLSGSIEWYSKKGIDLFANSLVDLTAGISSTGIVKNIANMKGSGVDIILNTANRIGQVNWSTNFLLSYNTDRVTDSYLSNVTGTFYVNDGSNITPIKGRPVHSVMSLQWAGLDPNTGNPQGYLAGKPSSDYSALTATSVKIGDLEYNGPGLPQYFGSLTNSFSYKGFSLDFNVSYKFRYFFKRKPLNYSALFLNDKKSTADFAARWQKPGDELLTDVPSLVYPLPTGRDNFYIQSSAIVEKGDHVRLQFVNLSYRFNIKKVTRSGGWDMTYFVNGSNLGILWKANDRGIDPDYSVSAIPPSAAFAAGIKLFFQ